MKEAFDLKELHWLIPYVSQIIGVKADSDMIGTYNLSLVILSFAIAVIASYTALDLAGRVQPSWGRERLLWLFGGAGAMGSGIWSMHFVAMLAFRLPQPVAYGVWLTLVSLVCAIIASGIALWLLSRVVMTLPLLLAGGLCMGGAIASMHYIGMAAMRIEATINYNPGLVITSVAIAVTASFVALWLAFWLQTLSAKTIVWQKLSAAIVMGIAISGMHYTGMKATHFMPPGMAHVSVSDSAFFETISLVEKPPVINPSLLAVIIGFSTLLILVLTLVTSLFDQRLSNQIVREKALQESEKWFRMLIREMQVGVLLLNSNAEILICNEAAVQLLNIKLEDLLNTRFGTQRHLFHEDGTSFNVEELPVQKAIAQRQSIHDVVVGIDHSPKRERQWLLIHADPQIAADGNVERVICTLSDITAQKQAEVALHQMAERERTVSRAIQRIRQTLDLETIFSATTQELRQVIDCDRVVIYRFNPNWSGEFVSESVAQEWASLIQQQSRHTELTEAMVEQENCAVKTFELVNSFSDTDTYLQETQGGVYGQGVSYLSVSDVYEAGFEPCYLERLERFQCKAYITVPIFCGDKLWGLLASYQNSGPRHWQELEIGIVTQIGTQLGVAVQQAELLAQTKQQAQELQAAKETADAASRAKSDFLARMSHELRTPLNSILGFTQLMNRDRSLSPEYQQYLNIISRSGEHLLDLINDVLEMSKIEAGQTVLNKTSFDLYRLLDNIEEMLQLKASSRSLQLTFNRTADVPQYVKTDEAKLRQVLINLLGNAIKFTEQGTVTLRVSAVTKQKEVDLNLLTEPELDGSAQHSQSTNPNTTSYVLFFEVEDTGSGIAPNELDKLFEVFGQTQSGLKAVEGTGLGLPISRTFVKLMGGEITVNSQPHLGSVFSFSIQAGLADEVAIQTKYSPSKKIIGLVPGQCQYRILIAEDSSTNRLLLVRLLSLLGFDVREAKNGQEAITVWEQWEPHLIWMDIQMPGMNGYEATQKIKASPKGQKTVVIALTASAFEEQRQAILAAGCDDFVCKPFRKEDVLSKMNQHLGVQYLYEEASPGKTEARRQRTESRRIRSEQKTYVTVSQLHSSALQVMPPEWINQLHYAASQCSDRLIVELIKQIPDEHMSLASALTGLTENFRFDQITALTQLSR